MIDVLQLPFGARFFYSLTPKSRKQSLEQHWQRRATSKPIGTQTDDYLSRSIVHRLKVCSAINLHNLHNAVVDPRLD